MKKDIKNRSKQIKFIGENDKNMQLLVDMIDDLSAELTKSNKIIQDIVNTTTILTKKLDKVNNELDGLGISGVLDHLFETGHL